MMKTLLFALFMAALAFVAASPSSEREDSGLAERLSGAMSRSVINIEEEDDDLAEEDRFCNFGGGTRCLFTNCATCCSRTANSDNATCTTFIFFIIPIGTCTCGSTC